MCCWKNESLLSVWWCMNLREEHMCCWKNGSLLYMVVHEQKHMCCWKNGYVLYMTIQVNILLFFILFVKTKESGGIRRAYEFTSAQHVFPEF